MSIVSITSKPNSRLAPPLDARDVLIRLESQGVGEAAARRRGHVDLWAMAEAQFRDGSGDSPEPVAPPAKRRSSAVREHMKGIAFALPLAVSGLAMLFLNFSLWGGALPPDLSIAVAVGTVASFVVSGGFVQALARRGIFYLGTNEPLACFESTLDWLGMGALALAITACAGLTMNWFFGWLTTQVALMATAFLLGLGVFWLATGTLYMLERNVEVLMAVTLGLAVVTILHKWLGVQVVLAQIAGVVTAAMASLMLGAWLLSRPIGSGHNHMRSETFVRKVLSVGPYFLYGVLLYVFLFTDRIVAWTSEAGPVRVVFRGDYEAAVNVALFAFVLQVGWVRVAGTAYRALIDHRLGACRATETGPFNLAVKQFYWQRLRLFALVSLASTLAVYAGSLWFGILKNSGIHQVALWALAACPLLVWSLWNANLLFGWSRPWAVLTAFGIACLVNLFVGYGLSRLFGYHLSAAGYTLGAAVLSVLSTISTHRTLDRCDYYNFASGA